MPADRLRAWGQVDEAFAKSPGAVLSFVVKAAEKPQGFGINAEPDPAKEGTYHVRATKEGVFFLNSSQTISSVEPAL